MVRDTIVDQYPIPGGVVHVCEPSQPCGACGKMAFMFVVRDGATIGCWSCAVPLGPVLEGGL